MTWADFTIWLFFTPQGIFAYMLFLACFPLVLAILEMFRK